MLQTILPLSFEINPHVKASTSEILKPQKLENSQLYQGILISRQSVLLQPQVSGQISQINVKAGDRVKTGDLLLVIDPRKQEALLNSYVVKRSALLLNYETAKIQYESSCFSYI